MVQFNITLTEEELHGLFLNNNRDKAIEKFLEKIFNEVLRCQSAEKLCVKPYERIDKRKGQRNDYYDRDLVTWAGTLNLCIPRHRYGEFSTEVFERYQSSERALLLAMMEMVVNGVLTRKVENVTEELCGKKFSKFTVSALCKKPDPIINAFRTKSLENHYPFLNVAEEITHKYGLDSVLHQLNI